ncbi:MAG: restriction endonuclease [Methylococcaceae bacterium]|nr:restriction endonuclease [Methylococcaceae bacterium]
MNYEELDFKIPNECEDYETCSNFVVHTIDSIIKDAMDTGRNKIIINTNLKLGIPMENVNKIAGPFIEAWAYEVFFDALEDDDNKYQLLNVEAGERLNMADIILQFKKIRKRQSIVTANVDVKATSKDIKNSGKAPNITSFARIRTAYIKNPDYIFIILSVKHSVYSTKDPITEMMMGIMEIVDFKSYDLKYIADSDISYNPALGTGQIQIKDIHYVTYQKHSTWEFCQLLDRKCIASHKGFPAWLNYANQYGWIK